MPSCVAEGFDPIFRVVPTEEHLLSERVTHRGEARVHLEGHPAIRVFQSNDRCAHAFSTVQEAADQKERPPGLYSSRGGLRRRKSDVLAGELHVRPPLHVFFTACVRPDQKRSLEARLAWGGPGVRALPGVLYALTKSMSPLGRSHPCPQPRGPYAVCGWRDRDLWSRPESNRQPGLSDTSSALRVTLATLARH